MPPEPKQRSKLARRRPRCPQNPNRGRSLPGDDLNVPGPQIVNRSRMLNFGQLTNNAYRDSQTNASSAAENGDRNDQNVVEIDTELTLDILVDAERVWHSSKVHIRGDNVAGKTYRHALPERGRHCLKDQVRVDSERKSGIFVDGAGNLKHTERS
ncbi:hypothetical protein B0H14DRAFT_2563904 [Mycena olivaceomarginata]|nr:hypothetical protein B0H14DRAFT_2563904 [Mycena olivaceomarginata]